MPKTKEILCLSNLAWTERTTRRQMIMSRMRDVRILYLDPPDGRLSSGKRPEPQKPYPHVTVYSSAGFLAPDSPLFATDPVRGLRGYLRYIRKILQKEKMAAPLLWLYSPLYLPLCDKLTHNGLVYDCADQFTRPSGGRKSALAAKREVSLCRRADAVFAARRDLFHKLEGFNPKTYLLPNGIDNRPKKNEPDPRIASYPRPLIGFAGDLSDGVDIALLEAAADATEGTLLLVTTGEMRDKLPREDYLRITSHENVVPVIAESQPAILDAAADFDLFLAPYREGAEESDLRTRVFFVSLASGKPIVSTVHSVLLRSFPGCVYASENPEEFPKLMKRALLSDDPARRECQLAFADGCRWEARVSEIRRLLAREGFLTD